MAKNRRSRNHGQYARAQSALQCWVKMTKPLYPDDTIEYQAYPATLSPF